MNTKNKVKYSGMVQLVDEWVGTKTDFVVEVKNGSIIIKEDKPVIKNVWTNEQKQDLDNRFAEQKTYIDNRFAEQKTYIDNKFAEQDKKMPEWFRVWNEEVFNPRMSAIENTPTMKKELKK